ncbi:TraR/DksA family transcriptional regulator [Streptomyces sp. ALB3]|uniref:TraR/DksA family transcriptional regulator n=1 Tax=Streptomyces sp. ALB3 TaxID=3374278 RepID=UPI0037BDBA2F
MADLGSTRAAVADERGVAEVAGRRLAETEAALQRLEDGTFGICTACGSPVDQERMLAVPQTELCVTCRRDAGSRRGTRTEGRE